MAKINFKAHIVRKEITTRGGGVEISLDKLGFKGEKMSAYQNYLGGGLLGSVQSNDTIRRETFRDKQTEEVNAKLDAIAEGLKEYFHSITDSSRDEHSSRTYKQNQEMPSSAY